MIDINIGGSLNVLLKASVKIRYNLICADQYGPSFIGADMMCASGPSGTGFCQVSLCIFHFMMNRYLVACCGRVG
jgi:hypothetical protein